MARKQDNNRYLYVDGAEAAHDAPAADFSTWNAAHPFTVANGVSLDLAWRGTVHLVAVYDRALTATEVAQNFAVGP